MAKLDKVLDFFDLDGNDDYDDQEDIYDDEDAYEEEESYEEPSGRRKSRLRGLFSRRSRNDSDLYEDEDYEEDPDNEQNENESVRSTSGKQFVTRRRNSSTGKVVTLVQSGHDVNVVETVRPRSIDDSPRIIDILKEGKPVVVSFEGIETSERQRIIDVVSGGSYAVNGKYCSVSKNIFIFAPENIEIRGDFINENERDDFPLMDGRDDF